MKRIAIIFISLYLAFFLFALGSHANARGLGRYDSFPGPQLVSPIADDIVLPAGSSVKFKWLCERMTTTDYYEFRLYKGYSMTVDTLIKKDNVKPGDCEIELPAESFEINQVYTWSLKQVFLSGQKSDKSFVSFKIIGR